MADNSMPDEPLADLSGRTLGEFLLRQQIGQGGYAVVYRCEQPKLQRSVVVKVLHVRGHRNDGAQERFLREAQLASKLDHPYAAHVYAFGAESDGLMWLAMEFVDGITLDDWLEQRGPMPLERFVPFLECVAEVVQTAHERGIVHRDLKPSNVMVIERGGRIFPKLLDFGIARVSDDEPTVAAAPPSPSAAGDDDGEPRTRTDPKHYRLTRTGSGMGSAPYMAPEQWNNARSAGAAADIYALGVVAFEALTGCRPFGGKTTNEYYRQHLHGDVPQLPGDLAPGLDRVIRRALSKDPDARHRDVMELASDLRAVLRAQPREQLRSSAQQWSDRARSRGLLWGGDELADLERWTRTAPAVALSDLECSFVAASQRRARRFRWLRRSFVMLAALAVLGGLQLRSAMRAEVAEQRAIASRVEQGRQALLHGESSDAVRYLEWAYQRGERSPAETFMLARALQPRMAEVARLTGSSARVWSATFTRDGKRILTTDDTSARMWDAGSGELLFTMRHGDTVYQAAFSPDEARIVTAGGDGTVRIWNAATGAPIRELIGPTESKDWRYYSVGVMSHFVAAIDTRGRAARVWDADTGTQVAELANDQAGAASLAVSADGRWLATSGGDDVRVFDASTWQRVATIAGPRTRSISFDPSGAHLITGTYDGRAAIWEIPTGARLHLLREAGESIDAVAFSRDGALVATGSRDGTEQVWDATSGGLRTEFNAHHNKIYAVEFSRTGDALLSAGADSAVAISNVVTGMRVTRLEGPTGLIFGAHFAPDAQRVVGASWDGTARVWEATSPYRRWASPPIGPECDTADSLVPDPRFIAVSCPSHGTRVWDTARGQLLADLPEVTAVAAGYYSALPAVTAAGDRVAIARDKTVEIYALPSGQLLHVITHTAPVNAVAFAPSGRDLASGAIDGSLMITHDDHDPVVLPSAATGIDAVSILLDGTVVVADANRRLRLIDPRTAKTIMEVAAPARVRLLRPSADGRWLITLPTTNEPVSPALWDVRGLHLVGRLEGHVGRAFTARFVGSDRQILTAGSDGTARLWDTATGRLRRTFRGDSHFLADATFTPDGSLVVAGGSDGLVRFWDVSDGRLLWTMSAHKSYVVGVHYEGNELVTQGFAGDLARWSLPPSADVIDACHAAACARETAEQE
jgi:WD40 repeat protein/serine/threonine protein kinase